MSASNLALSAGPSQLAPRRKSINPKLIKALTLMVDQGMPISEAAQTSGLTTKCVRDAFEREHVIAYVRKRKQMLRESVSARNILRLAEIRDAAENMPAVNAILALERMGADGSMQQSGATHGPGVTIIIGAVQTDERQPVKTTIDLKANPPDPDEPA